MTCPKQSGLKLECAMVRNRHLIGRSALLPCDHVCALTLPLTVGDAAARFLLTACARGPGFARSRSLPAR